MVNDTACVFFIWHRAKTKGGFFTDTAGSAAVSLIICEGIRVSE